MTDTAATPSDTVREALAAEAATLDHELAEIDMLIGQVKQEATRHEQKRNQAADRLAGTGGGPKEVADAYAQLMTLTRRAALMEAQVEVLEGKRKSVGRFRDAMLRHAIAPVDASGGAEDDGGSDVARLPAAASRAVLGAQEDLRREIARAMHDGPAQSLTNIVLQAQILERLVTKDPDRAKGEVQLLIAMVQQTLEATKSFIFDVRPMVLDDLGLMPTLRRAARERGRRAGVAIEFESVGADRRLPVEVESGLFRILDQALAGYLSVRPDTLSMRLDWGDRLEATVSARRADAAVADVPAEGDLPAGKDLPPALAAMVADRRGERKAKADAAREAAIASLPKTAWREIQQRAKTIGAEVELIEEGAAVRVMTSLEPPEPRPADG
ncbi:MAG TPA: histidine kinase [Vitreimonas sp.]|nr:histidine kinase [Vitreimonas sp.]